MEDEASDLISCFADDDASSEEAIPAAYLAKMKGSIASAEGSSLVNLVRIQLEQSLCRGNNKY
jgi:hypothetical protein